MLRIKTLAIVALGCGACGPSPVPSGDDQRDERALGSCVESIIEPQQGYLVGRIVRSYDAQSRPLEEKLVDLHPDHLREDGCYSQPTGYTRYVKRWQYDGVGRTLVERYEDLGDGTGCAGSRAATVDERRWVYDDAGHLLQESGLRERAGSTVSSEQTTYTYDDSGQLASATATQDSGSSSTIRWTYTPTGEPLQKEQIYLNNNGQRFLSSRKWTYDNGLLASDVDQQSRPLDGSDGFHRIERREYGAGGEVLALWIDHHEYVGGATYGPLGADGIYDSHTEYTHDEQGRTTSEKLVHDFDRGRIAQETAWQRDREGRLTALTIIPGHSGPYGSYTRKTIEHGAHGPIVERAYDASGALVSEVQHDYDARGHHILTRQRPAGGSFETVVAHAFSYDAASRITRWRHDEDGDGQWDGERRYDYRCGVDFTADVLGQPPELEGPSTTN